MLAYFVYDLKSNRDVVVLPEMGCSVAVDTQVMQRFIGVDPAFTTWTGDTCQELAPEDFGSVIATRDDHGDVCVLNEALWHQRMQYYLGAAG